MEKSAVGKITHSLLSRRVVVCGATGFIGSYLVVHLLEQGYTDIHIVSRTQQSCSELEVLINELSLIEEYKSRVTIHYGELLEYNWLCEVMQGCEVLFNCASIVDLTNSDTSIVAKNTYLAYIIAEAAINSGIKRIVHLGSIAALEVAKYPNHTTEECVIDNLSHKSNYAASKFYSENEIWRTQYSGVEVTVLLPAVVLGAPFGKKARSSSAIVERISRGVSAYTSGKTGYVMVEDVVRAMVTLSGEASSVGKRYIICGANLSYKELITKISLAFKKGKPRFYLSNRLVRFVGRIGSCLEKLGFNVPITSEMARYLTSCTHYDGSKVESENSF